MKKTERWEDGGSSAPAAIERKRVAEIQTKSQSVSKAVLINTVEGTLGQWVGLKDPVPGRVSNECIHGKPITIVSLHQAGTQVQRIFERLLRCANCNQRRLRKKLDVGKITLVGEHYAMGEIPHTRAQGVIELLLNGNGVPAIIHFVLRNL